MHLIYSMVFIKVIMSYKPNMVLRSLFKFEFCALKKDKRYFNYFTEKAYPAYDCKQSACDYYFATWDVLNR